MTEYLQGVSVRLATAMNRRRFIRRAATAAFADATSLAAGRLINPASAFGYASACESTGYGCPKGCGTSRCCSSKTGWCHCSDGSGGCQTAGPYCYGYANDWSGKSCWTCTYDECNPPCYLQVSTTCCDCATSKTACQPDGICIATRTTYTVIGGCHGNCSQPVGTVVGVYTGDPATSWGIQPPLAGIDYPMPGGSGNGK